MYENHLEGAKEQIAREPKPLPKVELPNFTSIWDWKYTDFELIGYDPHPKIEFAIAV